MIDHPPRAPWLQVFTADFISILALVCLAGLGLLGLTMFAAQFLPRARSAGLASVFVAFALGMVGLAISRAPPSAVLRCVFATALSPAGFVFGIVMLARAEEAAAPVSVGTWYSATEATQGVTFGALLACMAANVLLNAAATWYAAQV